MSNLKKATKQTFPKAFTPQELFADGSLGFAFDFRDPSLMFQDSGGVTPAEYGMPVGLVLDQSQGLRLSEELCHNGDFTKGEDGLEGWTGTGLLTKSEGGVIFKSSVNSIGGYASGFSYSIPVIPQTFCVVEFDARYIAGGPLAVGFYYMEHINVMPQENGGKFKRYRCIVGAYSTTVFNVNYILFGAAENLVSHWEINNVSIKRIYGNHAFQRTTTKRPILARSPRGGIRNLVVDSILSDPSKTTVYASSSLNDQKLTFNGDGSVTIQALQDDKGSMGVRILGYRENVKANTRYLVSIKAKASAGARALGEMLRLFFNNPQPTLMEEIENPGLSENYQRYVFALTFSAVRTFGLHISRKEASVAYSKGDELTFRDLQVELALPGQTEPTPYQKSNNLYDVTEQGVPDDTYLLFDGVDDALQTGEIKFGDANTTELSVWTGIIDKSSTNATRTILDSSPNNTAGALVLFSKRSETTSGIYFRLGALTDQAAQLDLESTNAGKPNIFTVAAKGGEFTKLSVNKTLGNQTEIPPTSAQSISNIPLFIGSRSTNQSPFQGQLHTLTLVSKLVDEKTNNTVEQYTNNRTGAY